MGHAAAARQSDIRVRDGTYGVVAARRVGGEDGSEGIRGFFLFFRMVGGEGEWMSGRWAASRPTIDTVRADGHPSYT
jgi:hypothetical protein